MIVRSRFAVSFLREEFVMNLISDTNLKTWVGSEMPVQKASLS